MKKKQKVRKKTKISIWSKIRNFLFPKNFKAELAKGMRMGSPHRQELGESVYNLGKFIRRKIDPKHKMKIGKEKKRGS